MQFNTKAFQMLYKAEDTANCEPEHALPFAQEIFSAILEGEAELTDQMVYFLVGYYLTPLEYFVVDDFTTPLLEELKKCKTHNEIVLTCSAITYHKEDDMKQLFHVLLFLHEQMDITHKVEISIHFKHYYNIWKLLLDMKR